MYVEKAAETTFLQKMRAYNVDEIDTYLIVLQIIFMKVHCGLSLSQGIHHYVFQNVPLITKLGKPS
jgi:hypothetical protein